MAIPLCLLLIIPVASSLTNYPIAHTSYGSVRGYEYQANNGFVGEIFKKIPFAAPPIGERRWKKPVPPEPWNYTMDGTFFGPACAQHPSYYEGYVTGFSEDCLTLNVYTSRSCMESNASCPVVFFIHGGNAITGGTMSFPDETLITNFATQGIIMVTIDYRLGVFGAMTLGDETVLPSNLFVHDVLESLRFTRQEIHNFGGDKDKLTIMGHSTGATMVLILAFSPGINKPGEEQMFARAIAMSASPVMKKKEKQVDRSYAVAAQLGCKGTAQNIVDCLLPFSTDELIQAAYDAGEDDAEKMLLDITLAGEIMPILSMKELRTNQKPLKLLIGTTSLELGTVEISRETDYVNTVLGVRNTEECSRKYKIDLETGKFEPGYSLISQATFMLNWIIANAQAKAGGKVQLYQFDYPEHPYHGNDMKYVVGSHENTTDANDEWLSAVYPFYFTNFIKGLPLPSDWIPVNPEMMNYYSVNKSIEDGIEPEMKLGYRQMIADYYRDIIVFDESVTTIKRKTFKSSLQYKMLPLPPIEQFNLYDVMFYSMILCIIFLVIVKVYQFCRGRKQSSEKIPILSDRRISKQ